MKKKIMVLVLGVMLMFTLIACGDAEEIKVEPPVPVQKVSSVQIQYNQKNIEGGILSVDISKGTVDVKAVVTKTADSVDGTVVFASSKPTVATITATGLITLVTKGETVISAKAGEQKQEIVLVVKDDFTKKDRYRITVVGGTSDIASAAEGAYVTLTAAMPLHKNFIEWEYKINDVVVTDLWLNGNIFAMRAADITVTAKYEDMLYTLNIVNGSVKDNETGETKDDMKVYKLLYDTDITAIANAEPDGKMFVGWDKKVKNNRVGTLGAKEYGPFKMPGETLTLWAVYSNKSDMGFGPGPWGTDIANGAPEGAADPDLEGMNGKRLPIGGATRATSADDYPENITGSNISNLAEGSQTMKVIFKNHHATLSVTVELYLTYYSTRVTTGYVTVPANSVVTKFVIARLGIDKPWMGFAVRADVGGPANEDVVLDMVVQKAATYPEGDKQFEVSGKAKWVTLGDYNNDTGWSRERNINNAIGLSIFAIYAGNFGENAYTRAKISNMPAYDAANATTRVYFRVINANSNVGTFDFNFGTNSNPTSPSSGSLVRRQIVLGANATELFYMDIPRTNNDDMYFSLLKTVSDAGGNYGHNFVVQMAYNNVIGVVEA